MNFACPSQEIVQQMQSLLTTMADMKREICDLRSQVKDAKRARVSEEVPPFPTMDERDLLDFFEHGLPYVVNKKAWPVKLLKSKLFMYENEVWTPRSWEDLCHQIKYALLPLFRAYADKHNLVDDPLSDYAELSMKFYGSLYPKKVETIFKDMLKKSMVVV